MIGFVELVLLLVIVGGSTLSTVFWVWMLIECVTKKPPQHNDRIVWTVVIALTHVLGAALYFVLRRPQRVALTGGQWLVTTFNKHTALEIYSAALVVPKAGLEPAPPCEEGIFIPL